MSSAEAPLVAESRALAVKENPSLSANSGSALSFTGARHTSYSYLQLHDTQRTDRHKHVPTYMHVHVLTPYAHPALHTNVCTFMKTRNAHLWFLFMIKCSIIKMPLNQKSPIKFY